jgi:hypothetical protein
LEVQGQEAMENILSMPGWKNGAPGIIIALLKGGQTVIPRERVGS